MLLFLGLLFFAGMTRAQESNEQKLQRLSQEIAQYEKEVSRLQSQANTLNNQIAQYDAQIRLTTLKITQVEEGYEIEKKSVFKVLDEMEKDGKEIYILDSKGEDLRKVRFSENSVLVIGDHEGFNKKEFKKLKSYGETVSIGSETYFASL